MCPVATRLPTEPLDPFWETFDPVTGAAQPALARTEPDLRRRHDPRSPTASRTAAVLLQWRDELPRDRAIRVQDFQDAAALQFSLSGKYGFLGMGDKDNPVNLWQWKAGWQAEPAAAPRT
jgi:DMSO reductase family type II enzyme heme b subunit